MSPRRWLERLRDILAAIEEIRAFTAGLDADTFAEDLRTRRAVEMNFIVIGEAASHVPATVQQQYPQVPWDLMRAMRNRLVHVYFDVEPAIVWDTINNDLPELVEPLRSVVDRETEADTERDPEAE